MIYRHLSGGTSAAAHACAEALDHSRREETMSRLKLSAYLRLIVVVTPAAVLDPALADTSSA